MIHVCYGMRDESGTYSKFVGASIESLLENTREEVTIHLIHDSTLTRENQKKLVSIVYKFDAEIFFYDVESLARESIERFLKIPIIKKLRYGLAMFYRLLIPDLLPREIERAIYLDSDTIVNLDIKDLWTIDLEDFPIAAFPEMYDKNEELLRSNFICQHGIVAPEDYFNSGVLMIDLNKTRGTKIPERCVKILLEHPKTVYLDQDALNVLFRDNYRRLPLKFNYFVIRARKESKTKIEPAIYHYLSRSNFLDVRDIFNKLWLEYFVRTPFCTAQTFGNMFDAIQKFIRNYTRIWHDVLLLSKPNRCFLTDPKYLRVATNFFGRIEGDLIIDSETPDALQLAIDRIKNDRRSILIFVDPQRFREIKLYLESLGLEENRDFFNAQAFIDNNQEIFNSHNFLKGM